jgi:periplasmic protein TonB
LLAAYARQIRAVPVELIDEVAAYFRLEPKPVLGQAERPSRQVAILSTQLRASAEQPAKTPPNNPETSLLSPGSWEQEDAQPLAITSIDTKAATVGTGRQSPAAAVPDKNTETDPAGAPPTSVKPSDPGLRGDAPAVSNKAPVVAATSDEAQDSSHTPGRLISERRLDSPRFASWEGSSAPPRFGILVQARERPRLWRGWSLISTGVVLLSALAGGGILLFHSGSIENAAANPARVVAESPIATHIGENSAAQAPPSTPESNAPTTSAATESTVAAGGAPKVTQRFAQTELSKPAKPFVPAVASALFESANAHTTTHDSEAHEVQVAPAPDPGPTSLGDSSASFPAVASAHPSGRPLLDPATPAPSQPGGRMQQARLLSSAAVAYPEAARQTHIQGDVVIQAVIDPSGHVTGMDIVSGSPLLRQAALDSLRQWRFEPGRLNGQPVSVQMLVTIRFRLSSSDE